MNILYMKYFITASHDVVLIYGLGLYFSESAALFVRSVPNTIWDGEQCGGSHSVERSVRGFILPLHKLDPKPNVYPLHNLIYMCILKRIFHLQDRYTK